MVWLKRTAWGLAALFTLAAIGLAIILVPAHLQMRAIEPDLPSEAELLALMEEPDKPVRISYFLTSEQMNSGSRMGHSTFVIEWADGTILLVDGGMDRKTAMEFSDLVQTFFDAEPATFHGTAADILGGDAERVSGIGFTHLHVDHVQGIEPLCAVVSHEIAALQTDLQAGEHNFNTGAQQTLIEQASCLTGLVLAEGEHTSPDFPGVGIYPLAGHTPGSTMFAVPVGDRLWLLSGDIVNARADMVQNRPKGFFYRNFMVPEHEARQSELRKYLNHLDQAPQISTIVSHDADALAASGIGMWQQPSD